MKRAIAPILIALALISACAATPKTIRVTGPTVVAFFPPVSEKELDKENDALDDFQWYARQVRAPFTNAGITFHELYAPSFRLSINEKVKVFRPKDPGVGYYFIAPGKQPFVTYGVDTESGLFQTARDYFGIVVQPNRDRQK
jgi:hypothetical protein